MTVTIEGLKEGKLRKLELKVENLRKSWIMMMKKGWIHLKKSEILV